MHSCRQYGMRKNDTVDCIGDGKQVKKILIVTTASLKTNWKRELMLYNDETDIQILNGSKDTITNKSI